MGKLSKLRKEIEKDPKGWLWHDCIVVGTTVFKTNTGHRIVSKDYFSNSHKNFIKSVLKDLGYIE